MKKVKIKMKEIVSYDKEVIVSIPDDYSLDTIGCLLDAAGKERDLETAEDVIHFLSKNGCEVIDRSDGFNNSEVEIYDYRVLDED